MYPACPYRFYNSGTGNRDSNWQPFSVTAAETAAERVRYNVRTRFFLYFWRVSAGLCPNERSEYISVEVGKDRQLEK